MLPIAPGVYLMSGERADLLYVGKGRTLRFRNTTVTGEGGFCLAINFFTRERYLAGEV
jgi:hypothetical protein